MPPIYTISVQFRLGFVSTGVCVSASRRGDRDLHMQWAPEVLRNGKALQGSYGAQEQVET